MGCDFNDMDRETTSRPAVSRAALLILQPIFSLSSFGRARVYEDFLISRVRDARIRYQFLPNFILTLADLGVILAQ